MKKKIILITVLVLAVSYGLLAVLSNRASAPSKQQDQAASPRPTTTAPPPAFDKTQFSTTDPTSPWVIINKTYPLPQNYVPADLTPVGGEQLRAEATAALNNLLAGAKAAGSPMVPLSGFRSYATQVSTYNAYIAKDGRTVADTYSARPGHSEHQTGWAMDVGNGVCDLEICFIDTAAGQWLAAHAHEHGFIIRFLNGKEAITGYQYEPWHIRYVGTALAAELYKTGQTMEEFFGVTSSYR